MKCKTKKTNSKKFKKEVKKLHRQQEEILARKNIDMEIMNITFGI